MKNRINGFLPVFTLFFLVAGCVGGETENIRNATVDIPNPAAARCVEDGYELEPFMVDGVSADYLCVNPENGKKCGIWPYFRGECDLKK